jgi:hypothetical protein
MMSSLSLDEVMVFKIFITTKLTLNVMIWILIEHLDRRAPPYCNTMFSSIRRRGNKTDGPVCMCVLLLL